MLAVFSSWYGRHPICSPSGLAVCWAWLSSWLHFAAVITLNTTSMSPKHWTNWWWTCKTAVGRDASCRRYQPQQQFLPVFPVLLFGANKSFILFFFPFATLFESYSHHSNTSSLALSCFGHEPGYGASNSLLPNVTKFCKISSWMLILDVS